MNDEDFTKFVRICGMLGSDHEGERANAAALATKLLRDNDLMWDQVLANPITKPPAPPPEPPKHTWVDDWKYGATGNPCLFSKNGCSCTVFPDKKKGGWKFVINDEKNNAMFWPTRFKTRNEAMVAAAAEFRRFA